MYTSLLRVRCLAPYMSVALARYYQSLIMGAIAKEATPGRFSRIAEYLTKDQMIAPMMYDQWIDVLNADFIHMTRKRRAESLSTIVRDIVEWDANDQCLDMMSDVDRFAEEQGCPVSSMRLSCDAAYDEELRW